MVALKCIGLLIVLFTLQECIPPFAAGLGASAHLVMRIDEITNFFSGGVWVAAYYEWVLKAQTG